MTITDRLVEFNDQIEEIRADLLRDSPQDGDDLIDLIVEKQIQPVFEDQNELIFVINDRQIEFGRRFYEDRLKTIRKKQLHDYMNEKVQQVLDQYPVEPDQEKEALIQSHVQGLMEQLTDRPKRSLWDRIMGKMRWN